MKLIFALVIVFAAGTSWGWSVTRTGCITRNFPENKNIVTYTSVNFAAGPDVRVILTQTTRLENSPPNMLLGQTEYEKFGAYSEVRKINPDMNPFAALFGTPQYDGYSADSGTLYNYRGSMKMSKVTMTFSKRYSDGEPNMARVDIYTKDNANSPWILSESISDCYISAVH